MTVLFCGDPHGRFRHIESCARDVDATAVVLLGDVEPLRGSLDVELSPWLAERTWLIAGNHDFDSDLLYERVLDSKVWHARSLHRTVERLPASRTRPEANVAVAGLSGIFEEGVWAPDPGSRLRGVPRFRTREEHSAATAPAVRFRGGPIRVLQGGIYPEDVLPGYGGLGDVAGGVDILVTHEAPSYHPKSRAGRVLDELAAGLGVRALVHGHHHVDVEDHSNPAFVAYGVGLRGILGLSLTGDGRLRFERLVRGE